jgi:hypothetical protein
MRIRVILLLIIVGFFMNGCLADRIKQRMYYLKMKDKIAQQHKNRAIKSQKLTRSSVENKENDIVNRNQKKLYEPSAPEVIQPISDVEEVTLVSEQKKQVVKKKKKAISKSNGVRKNKKVKKSKKKEKKKSYEPYSIEDDKKDPELLGPQTTLESNPLLEQKDKI